MALRQGGSPVQSPCRTLVAARDRRGLEHWPGARNSYPRRIAEDHCSSVSRAVIINRAEGGRRRAEMPRKRGSIEAVQTPEAKRACIPGLTPAEIVAMAVPEPTRGTHDYTYAPPCARVRARSLRPVVAGFLLISLGKCLASSFLLPKYLLRTTFSPKARFRHPAGRLSGPKLLAPAGRCLELFL